MIRPICFIETAQLTAYFLLKYKDRLRNGVLELRGEDATDVLAGIVDRPILQEWKTARSFLHRMQQKAQTVFNKPVDLGKAWIEVLPGNSAVPWALYEDDYAQAVVRTRTGLIHAPDCFTFSGHFREAIGTGVVNLVEHRVLHSETNFSEFPRTHLVVDFFKPDADEVE